MKNFLVHNEDVKRKMLEAIKSASVEELSIYDTGIYRYSESSISLLSIHPT